MPEFFDAYPRFYETSTAGSAPNRLNAKYRAIIAENRDYIEGQRILDLASHDGRWSFAALVAGAAHVTGIEARERLISAARSTFTSYNMPARHYSFICGTLPDALSALEPRCFDTILCLGFLYHTFRHAQLFEEIRRLAPRCVIVDSLIAPGDRAILELNEEETVDEGNAIGDLGARSALVARPSRNALELLVRQAGFNNLSYFDWRSAGLTDWTELTSYRDERRVTLRACCSMTQGGLHASARGRRDGSE